MGANGVRVNSEERHRDECTVTPETEHRVPKLERSMMFIGIALVEVDIFKKRWTSYLSNATFF